MTNNQQDQGANETTQLVTGLTDDSFIQDSESLRKIWPPDKDKGGFIHQAGRGLQFDSDAHPEFMLNGDAFNRVIAAAVEIGKKNPKPAGLSWENPQDHAAINEHVRALSDKIITVIRKEHGYYNQKIAAGVDSVKDPSMHNDMFRANLNIKENEAYKDQGICNLSEFKSGELICRHYAGVLGIALDSAGVENYVVGGSANFFDTNNNQVKSMGRFGHMFVVIKETGAVVDMSSEATHSTHYYANPNYQGPNHFIAGKSLAVAVDDKYIGVYNLGHDGSAAMTQIVANRKAIIDKEGIGGLALDYDKNMKNPYFMPTGKHAASHRPSMESYNQTIAETFNSQTLQPMISTIDAAVDRGDISVLDSKLKELSVGKAKLVYMLRDGVAKQKTPLVDYILDKTDVLEHIHNPALAAAPLRLPFDVEYSRPIDIEMQKKLIDKLDITLEQYTNEVIKTNRKDYLDAAIEIVKGADKSPANDMLIARAQAQIPQAWMPTKSVMTQGSAVAQSQVGGMPVANQTVGQTNPGTSFPVESNGITFMPNNLSMMHQGGMVQNQVGGMPVANQTVGQTNPGTSFPVGSNGITFIPNNSSMMHQGGMVQNQVGGMPVANQIVGQTNLGTSFPVGSNGITFIPNNSSMMHQGGVVQSIPTYNSGQSIPAYNLGGTTLGPINQGVVYPGMVTQSSPIYSPTPIPFAPSGSTINGSFQR